MCLSYCSLLPTPTTSSPPKQFLIRSKFLLVRLSFNLVQLCGTVSSLDYGPAQIVMAYIKESQGEICSLSRSQRKRYREGCQNETLDFCSRTKSFQVDMKQSLSSNFTGEFEIDLFVPIITLGRMFWLLLASDIKRYPFYFISYSPWNINLL